MKKKQEASWTDVVGFAILLLLGLAVPFWMEYKSFAHPPVVPQKAADGRSAIEQGKKYYCPACGAELTIPSWNGQSPQPDEQVSALSLRNMTTAPLDVPLVQRPSAEILNEAP